MSYLNNKQLKLQLIEFSKPKETNEYLDIPIDITDIITVCKEYSNLGSNLQNQVESILDLGIEESIKTGKVKLQSLPHIKFFLKSIVNNPYFGDATDQCNEIIDIITLYQSKFEKTKLN